MLKVDVAGLELSPPLVLASGILGVTAKIMARVSEHLGAITTKSVGARRREGYPNPVVCPLPYGLLNAMGLPNPGIDYFEEVIREFKKLSKKPIIVSVIGSDSPEYVSSRAEEAGADAIELNVSCPHAGGLLELGMDTEQVRRIVRDLKSILSIPLFVKLSPNIQDIGKLAETCEKAGADGITAINTVRAVKIDLLSKKPLFKSIYCGLSGAAIHPIAVRCVYEIYEKVSIPIIGVGGVVNWESAVELILAGASAVGIGTALTQDIAIAKEIASGILEYMRSEGFKSVSEMIGLAHKR
ncbi:MAG: dihydroorotate dehydrogenase [Thermoproteota archaeon]|nr:MAG: dihydroorotate dehydrogenase [Candidatus Korarchaeota archaeon]